MGAFHPFFSIDIEHTFFKDGRCVGLEFVAIPKTRHVLTNAGLLVKKTRHGLSVFYDEDRREALRLFVDDPEEKFWLGFKVFSQDPTFRNYTDLPSQLGQSILYFDNRKGKKDKAGRFRLHQDQFVSDKNVERLDACGVSEFLNKKDVLVNPLFLLSIFWGGKKYPLFDKNNQVAHRSYYVSFKSRDSFWKYYLVGEMGKKSPVIMDVNKTMEFQSTGHTRVTEQQTALTFRSTKPIPFREQFDYRFQLQANGNGAKKILMKRLPMASARHITKEVIEGEEAVVSEIFINC